MATFNDVFVLLVGKAVDGGNKKEVKGKGSFKKSSKFANVIMASKKMSTAKKTPNTSSTSSIFDGEMLPDEELTNRFYFFLDIFNAHNKGMWDKIREGQPCKVNSGVLNVIK